MASFNYYLRLFELTFKWQPLGKIVPFTALLAVSHHIDKQFTRNIINFTGVKFWLILNRQSNAPSRARSDARKTVCIGPQREPM